MREIKFRVFVASSGLVIGPFPLKEIGIWLDDGDIALQYTGLKDKNGKEIYEGDIVRITSIRQVHNGVSKTNWPSDWIDKTYVFTEAVEWGETIDEFGPAFAGYPFARLDNLSGDRDWVEVIGNIYENPELLKEVK